ncbi:MAG: hypothetical protein QOI26_2662 [Pseudonocardiales bacterium]|nr:hypothetical protein [Pseudonocardiales bacterium]
MKRITFAMMSTLTALVLLFGYRTSTSSRTASSGTVAIGGSVTSGAASGSVGSGRTSGSAGSPPAGPSSSSGTPSSTSAAAVTVTGAEAQTRYGPVRVQLTTQNRKITNVSVVEYPTNSGRDQEINAVALPILVNETLSSQNAKIDMVSGATYTSEGYLTSLQSALDQAGL